MQKKNEDELMAKHTEPIQDPYKITKEVFNTTDVETKTELTTDQIRRVNLLQTMGSLFGNGILENHLDGFMALQKSKDRASLKEFVESLKSKKDELMDKTKSFHLMG